MGFHGIFCFSSKPLEYVTFLGAFITAFGAFISFIYMLQSLFVKEEKRIVRGGTCITWLLGGLNMFICGILGEYVSRIYDDVKGRQRFIIDEFDKNC